MSNEDPENIHKLRFLGRPNLLVSPAMEVLAASEYSASYAAENILTVDPAQKWRSASLRPNQNVFLHYLNSSTSVNTGLKIDAVGLVGHNLWDRTGHVRFVLTNGAVEIPSTMLGIQQVLALGSSDAVNADGNYSNLGGLSGGSPAGIGATNPTLPWSIQLTMAPSSGTPRGSADNPDVGACFHWLALWCVLEDTIADVAASEAPLINVTATDVPDGFYGGPKPITKLSGQWVFFRFDADGLVPPDGSSFTFTLSGTPAWGTVYNARVTRLVWMCETDSISGHESLLHDTGWLPVGSGSEWEALQAERFPYQDYGNVSRRDFYHSFDETVEGATRIYTFLRDDHVPGLDDYTIITSTMQPPPYLEIGHEVGGLEFIPYYGRSNGVYIAYMDHGSKSMSSGLGTYGQALGVRRSVQLNLRTLTIPESNYIEDRLLSHGFLSPVLISVNPGRPSEATLDRRLGTIFGTLREAENPVAHREVDTGDYPRSMNLLFEEFR